MQGGLQRAYLLCLNMFTEIPPSVKFLRSIKLHFTKCSQRLTLIYRVQRTTLQGIGLRDTCYDPGEMFPPPQKGAVCANPEDKNCQASNRAYFLFSGNVSERSNRIVPDSGPTGQRNEGKQRRNGDPLSK